MSQAFARKFYNSQAWREVRKLAYDRDSGLCVECAKRGIVERAQIVHHITELTPGNIDNPTIALGLNNLVSVCRPCHARLHGYTKSATREGLYFDAYGNLKSLSECGQGLN